MTDAFAGFMSSRDPAAARSSTRAPSSSASTCRATPRSPSRRSSTSTSIELLWADVNLPPTLRFHSAAGYRATLAHLGHDLQAYFGAGARPTQWDVAACTPPPGRSAS